MPSAFLPGNPCNRAVFVFPENGSFTEIERQLLKQGRAHIQVTLNVDSLEYNLASDGAMKFTAPSQSIDAAAKQARNLLGAMNNQEAEGYASAVQQFDAMVGQFTGRSRAEINPEFNLLVTREGLEKLASSKEVRSIKPVGFIDPRPMQFPDEIIEYAQKQGTARVIMSLRPPLSSIGLANQATFDAHKESNLRA